MLAPNPSQHLESENPARGNPLSRFNLPESCSRLAHFLFDELTIGLREPPMLLGLVQEPNPHQAGCGCRGQRPQTNRFAFVLLA